MRTRRRFSAEFKAKVALEAIKGDETLRSWRPITSCTPLRLLPGSVRRLRSWPRCSTRMGSNRDKNRDGEITKLHGEIGQLVVERDFFVESLRSLSLGRRKTMIDPGHPRLSIVRQCELASISRASFYREPAAENEETLRLMRLIDEQFLETPWYGSRQMALFRCEVCKVLHRKIHKWSPKKSLAVLFATLIALHLTLIPINRAFMLRKPSIKPLGV